MVDVAAAVDEINQSGRKTVHFFGNLEDGIQTNRIIFAGTDDHRTAAGDGIRDKG